MWNCLLKCTNSFPPLLLLFLSVFTPPFGKYPFSQTHLKMSLYQLGKHFLYWLLLWLLQMQKCVPFVQAPAAEGLYLWALVGLNCVPNHSWGTGASSRATSGSIARPEVCMPVTQCMGGCDSFWIPSGAGDRATATWAVDEFSGMELFLGL